MSRLQDITGQKFARLTVIERNGSDKYKNAVWLCKCDCGNTVSVTGRSLRNGNTKSCGCYNIEVATNRIVSMNTKHGKTNIRLFRVWSSMKTRCENPNATNYEVYGGRGISICDTWKNDFEEFYDWAISQGYDPNAKRGKYTVDRIDNNKGYSPDNCRLANLSEQANNRRNNRYLVHNGIRKTQAEWARHYGRHITIFQHMTDDEAVRRMEVYDAYMREKGVNELPKRGNYLRSEWGRRHL